MKYFAYGSNMDSEKIRERGIHFSQRIHATLLGYRLEFNKVSSRSPEQGYANIVPFENGIVEGVLYDIEDSDLSKLDGHEGCPDQYERVKVEVQLDNREKVEAVAYMARPDRVRYGLKPSRDYIEHLLAASNLLSESYRRKLAVWETLED